MDFSAFFEANEYAGRKARYYKSLGYSEQAAAVLAVLTYGSAPLSRLVSSFPKEQLFESLYNLLAESETAEVMEAIGFFLSSDSMEFQS